MQSESTYKDRCGDAFVYIAFAAYAAVLGGFLSRLPDIQLALKASNYEFGLILLGVPTGIIIGSVFFSAFIERIGAKKSSAVFTIIFSICPILSGAASSGVALAASLALQGLMLSLANVSINVLAHQMEKAQDRRLLNKCHGVWSITLLAASLAGAGMVALGINYEVQFSCTFIIVAFLLLSVYTVSRSESSMPGSSRRSSLVLPTRMVLLIAAYASATVMIEGITRNWGIIYLRDTLSVSGEIAALGLPLVILSQAAGRLIADSFIERHGVSTMAICMILICASGCILLATSTGLWTGLLGILLIGLGVSTAHPQSVAAAAALGDRPPAENVAAFSSVQTLLVYCGPSLFGILSEGTGLRLAMFTMAPLLLATIFFVPAISARR